jgi:hypothetical protein
MGEPSVFEKIISRKRLLDAVGSEPTPAPPAPPKPKGTRRVPTRDPATGKIVWIDVPED